MNTCAICRCRFEAESPAVLFISRYGTPRVLCAECEALLDTATAEEESLQKKEAIEKLNDFAMTTMKDPEAIKMLGAIVAGEIDDENAPTPEEEEEMAAVLEEVAKEEEEEARRNGGKANSDLFSYLMLAGFGVALIFFVVYFYFFR